MLLRVLALIAAFALLLPAAYAAEKPSGPSPFHPPDTEAEKAIDQIVKTAIAKPEMFPTILQKPGYDLSKTKGFEPLFTDAFLVAWRQFEKEMVDQYCGGRYRPEKDCGYGIDPVVCSDKLKPPFSYRTILGDSDESLITLVSADDGDIHHTYYLKHEKGRWRLGGLYCEMDLPETIPDEALIKKFRQPKLASEKKLEKILQLARTNKGIIPYILDLIWNDPAQNSRFSKLFTPALQRAWKQQAKEIVRNQCDEKYYESGIGGCEFFVNPIFCRIEEIDLFILRTTVEDRESSVVTYSHPGGHPGWRAVYHMTKSKEGWKLDGVDCDDKIRYHMP